MPTHYAALHDGGITMSSVDLPVCYGDILGSF